MRLLADHPASTAGVLAGGDAIDTVCDSADREVPGEHTHGSIPDPVPVGTAAAFERTLADLTHRIDGWVRTSTAGPDGAPDQAWN